MGLFDSKIKKQQPQQQQDTFDDYGIRRNLSMTFGTTDLDYVFKTFAPDITKQDMDYTNYHELLAAMPWAKDENTRLKKQVEEQSRIIAEQSKVIETLTILAKEKSAAQNATR